MLRSRCSLGPLLRITIPPCRCGGVGSPSISCERFGLDHVARAPRIRRIEHLPSAAVASLKEAPSFLGLHLFGA